MEIMNASRKKFPRPHRLGAGSPAFVGCAGAFLTILSALIHILFCSLMGGFAQPRLGESPRFGLAYSAVMLFEKSDFIEGSY